MNKFVYSFNEGSKDMKNLLGSKGANLAEMTKMGLPVPYGFTITTDACNSYYENDEEITDNILDEIYGKLIELEEVTGKKLGDEKRPLLVSVRSGSVFSMPGMMDTVLNLGLNDKTVIALGNFTQNHKFALDSYRRFIQMFSNVVMNIPLEKFEDVLQKIKEKNKYTQDSQIDETALYEIIEEYKKIFFENTGRYFPQEPKIQLIETVEAVFKSWNNERAKLYRKMNKIDDNLGTAVNIQSMVFGNKGNKSATGVASTRNPVNGEKELYGEFLLNAQGEDVVSGMRTPMPIKHLEKEFPQTYQIFLRIAKVLEEHYKDMQDMEFTIEDGKLYMLQTRSGKRTAKASIKIAVDMEEEGIIEKEKALMSIDAKSLEQLFSSNFDEEELSKLKPIAKGISAVIGSCCGKIAFSYEEAKKIYETGENVILVKEETSTEDLKAITICQGILTKKGGMSSHIAVVARSMGKCCITGVSEIKINKEENILIIGDEIITATDYISLDGKTGAIYKGQIKTIEPVLSDEFYKVMKWTEEYKSMKIRVNAENQADCKKALELGAKGIGLCRSENMFFREDRILDLRKMILAEEEKEKQIGIDKLMEYQLEDFTQIYEIMEDRPVSIRLLDPPLHEFLPKTIEEYKEVAEYMNRSLEYIKEKTDTLKETNPMLGHRGCRVGISYPSIIKMQVQAIIKSAIKVMEKKNITIIPEIMVPLISSHEEMKYIRNLIDDTINALLRDEDKNIEYMIGTMIETPRACIVIEEIAKYVDFISFGTNDLSQMTYGFSRDDTGNIIREYLEKDILKFDPFVTIDEEGVGKLIKFAIDKAKTVKENIKIGICGEQSADPDSIVFCQESGIQYVSTSPYKIPIAKLAIAQATIYNE